MNANLEMMNYIYQNAQMGQDTMTQLLDIVDDEKFLTLLKSQRDEYKAIFDECDKKINDAHAEPKGVGKIAEFSTYVTLNMKTMTNKSSTHIAGMIMQGSVMGIIDITRNLRKYQDAESDILSLGKRLLRLEEDNLSECKKFL